jgi:hypothetical protein
MARVVLTGSWWSVLLVVPFFPLLVWRILDEKNFLRKDLPGYAKYMERVRYCLVPRMRLGGGPNLLEDFPTKPARMHARTYDRLLARAMTATERWIGLQRCYLGRHYPGLLS